MDGKNHYDVGKNHYDVHPHCQRSRSDLLGLGVGVRNIVRNIFLK